MALAIPQVPNLVIINLYGEEGALYPDAAAAAQVGAEDFMTKPLDIYHLLAHAQLPQPIKDN